MKQSVVRWLLRCYPQSWRVEYGAEFEKLLHQRPLSMADVRNVLWSAGIEQVRQPVVRFWLSVLLLWGCLWGMAWVVAEPLWLFLSKPAVRTLQDYGNQPPVLIASTPWEQFTIIWLGLPWLITVSVGYPGLLFMIWRSFANNWPNPKRQWVQSAALWSGLFWSLSLWMSGALWQRGWPLTWLLSKESAVSHVGTQPWLSVSNYFYLLMLTTLGEALLLQVPVLLWWRWKGRNLPAHKSLVN